jgi:hypothetical protein
MWRRVVAEFFGTVWQIECGLRSSMHAATKALGRGFLFSGISDKYSPP